jgi:lysophospholipase L1-like esterase
MDETGNIVLLFSLIINFLFLGLAIIFVFRKGGISYLILKLSAEARIKSMYDSPFYRDKKSHFESLPKSETEVMFLGDSITDCCEWQEVFRTVRIKNRGISGDTTEGVLNRIDEIVESHPQKLFLMIGINDINQGRQVDDIFKSYQVILRKLKEQTPETKVFIQSVLPVNNQKFLNNGANDKVVALNAKLKELAQEYSLHYIDLFSSFADDNRELDARYTTDGVHLNGQGYLLWKGIIEKDVVN